MVSRLGFLLLFLSVALTSSSVIRRDADEVEINKGFNGTIEGDVVLTKDQLDSLNAVGKRVKRQITTIWKKWPNGRVYYYFEDSFTTLKRDLFATAFAFISSQSCVTFEESRTATNRIKFMSDGGCASYVGMNGGEQALWFSDGCNIFGTAVHEVMHALGIFHTHSRFDRDDFLSISLAGVPESMLGNLDKETSKSTYNAAPFEYGSTMLYRYNTWGDGTLTPKQSIYEKTMGLRRVSFYDLVTINSRYQCICPTNLACKNGGYTNPAKCSQCVCPPGFGGTLCDGPPPNAVQLTAESYLKGYWISFGYANKVLTTNFYMAYLYIKAPADKSIEVTIVEMTNFDCAYGCNYNGVEMKLMGDPRITNPVYCCADDAGVMNQKYLSKQNPMPIVLHQRFGSSRVAIHYRYVDIPLSSYNKTTNGYDSYQYYA